jgi:hypothetical protein
MDANDLLEQYLAETPNLRDWDDSPDLSKWKKLPKRQIIDLIEAILKRYTWLREHDNEIGDAHVQRIKLVHLLRVLYTTKKLPCTEADLRMMLDLTAPLFEYIAPDGPVDYVMEYIKDNDLTPELSKSLHNFQSNLQEAGSVSSMQSLRQRLHTLLFMDEWEPLNPAKCWSETIRRDFRAMEGERKVHWRRLLKHIRGNAPQIMPPAWAREAAERLAAVGIEDFNQQLAIWFAPFHSGQPLPLSVAGSHVLKGLVWYAGVSGDENAKEIALWLMDVKWKQKKNTDKSMVALGVFGISKEELEKRKLLAEPRTSPPPRILQTILDVLRGPNIRTHMAVDPDENMIVVQGQLHFYRIFRDSCRIERVTDNKEIELNWEKIPDQFRLTLHRECAGEEQIHLRAMLLMYDSLNVEYLRVK